MMRAIATELAASPAKRKQLQVIIKNPPAEPWTRQSREELILALREQRDAWELMSRRCHDMPDGRLASEPHAWLVKSLKWYYSDEARAIAAGWLVELLQYVESTDRRHRPEATVRASAGGRAAKKQQKEKKKPAPRQAPPAGRELLQQEGFRYFECRRGGASKFWAIRARGRRLTVSFGRIGARGAVQTKDQGSPAACARKAELLIREKQAKGYRER